MRHRNEILPRLYLRLRYLDSNQKKVIEYLLKFLNDPNAPWLVKKGLNEKYRKKQGLSNLKSSLLNK